MSDPIREMTPTNGVSAIQKVGMSLGAIADATTVTALGLNKGATAFYNVMCVGERHSAGWRYATDERVTIKAVMAHAQTKALKEEMKISDEDLSDFLDRNKF